MIHFVSHVPHQVLSSSFPSLETHSLLRDSPFIEENRDSRWPPLAGARGPEQQ